MPSAEGSKGLARSAATPAAQKKKGAKPRRAAAIRSADKSPARLGNGSGARADKMPSKGRAIKHPADAYRAPHFPNGQSRGFVQSESGRMLFRFLPRAQDNFRCNVPPAQPVAPKKEVRDCQGAHSPLIQFSGAPAGRCHTLRQHAAGTRGYPSGPLGQLPPVARLESLIRAVPFRQRRNRLSALRASGPCAEGSKELARGATHALCGGSTASPPQPKQPEPFPARAVFHYSVTGSSFQSARLRNLPVKAFFSLPCSSR